MNDPKEATSLPVQQPLTFAFATSLAIVVLMGIGCSVAVLQPTVLYPTRDVLRSSLPADLVNLLGMPLLLIAMWLARHRSFLGLLLWPGALLFLLYHDLAFLFGMPLSTMFLLHLLLATMNLYGTMNLVASIDGTAVEQRLAGRVFERASGGVLIGLGTLFLVWAIAVMVNSLLRGTPITTSDFALRVTDILMSPAWIIGGVLLWRRRALGYVGGLGLLFQASMLFIGLIVLFAFRPFVSGRPFPVTDAMAVFAMGMVCFIPFALFVQGVVWETR